MEETISLKEIYQMLVKRWKLIIFITLTVTMVSGIISYFFLTPIYQTSTQLLVNQSNEENNAQVSEIQYNLQLIKTYNVIIKSPLILDLVIEELELAETSSQLNNRITVGSEQDSQVVSITVKDENPERAVTIANTIASVFQEEVQELMNVENVSILSKAELGDNPSPVEPKKTLNVAIAFVVGLMISVGLAFLLEYLDTSIKSEQDIEKILGVPVLGSIMIMNQQEDQKQIESLKRSGEARHV
ncbi:Wzz/FepE/Etk N-terminal domain-containing protein [Bacillus carboniphilus]|uniref:Wzz/FepE/Etk N-terminal domain-containing protein n=1 Tax=Bacillus carboniphilus TaxID=86663 RepID=A0ABY9JV72_9BACI|nr:Wzz/FepE/Etk N-terminal domain-containing protein [Bacillus carboniphilus]WLR41581.1 Wzz/FepE/Etk N-terminal domain-containing protein [Bacillus carboniphilus]